LLGVPLQARVSLWSTAVTLGLGGIAGQSTQTVSRLLTVVKVSASEGIWHPLRENSAAQAGPDCAQKAAVFFGAVEIEMVRPVTRVRRCKPDDHSCELSTITDLMHYLDTIFKSRNLAEGGAIWL
jgi:hypothetical protein